MMLEASCYLELRLVLLIVRHHAMEAAEEALRRARTKNLAVVA